MERSITIYGLRELDLVHDALETLFDDVNKQWEQSQYKDQDLDKYLDDINSLLERVRQTIRN
jgi:hypothetical protein